MSRCQIIGFSRLADVLHQLAHTSGKTAFISGGTDFINNNTGKGADIVIDLSQVVDLTYISDCGDEVRIGSGTTFSALAASPVIRSKVTALAEAAARVGSVQIRNRATIGGNIASASPAGDSLPVLAALGARICTAGPAGSRVLSLEATLSTLKAKELITEIVIPTPGNQQSGFVKLGSRSQVTIARISLAAAVRYDHEKKTIISGTAALGALGKMPVLPPDIQRFFTNRSVDSCFADDLALLLARAVDKAIAGRASHPYKSAAVKGLAYDLTNLLFGSTCTKK